jgi:hypothetical protein
LEDLAWRLRVKETPSLEPLEKQGFITISRDGLEGVYKVSMLEESRVEKKESRGDIARRIDDGFDQFWSAYPKKAGKKAAIKEWQKATDKPAIEVILKAIEDQKKSRKWVEGFILDPERWIKRGCWTDEPEAVEPSNRTPVKPIAYSEDFETLWELYPESGRVEKLDAWQAWQAALPVIMEQAKGNIRENWMRGAYNRIEGQKTSKAWKDGFIPKLATWIQKGGWEQ